MARSCAATVDTMDSPAQGASDDGDFTRSIAIDLIRLSWSCTNQRIHIPSPPQKENGVALWFPFLASVSIEGKWSHKLTITNVSARRGYVSASRRKSKSRCNLSLETTVDMDIASIRNMELSASRSAEWLEIKLGMRFYEKNGLKDLLSFMNASHSSASDTAFLEVELLRNGNKTGRKRLPLKQCQRDVDAPGSDNHPWDFTFHLPLNAISEGDQNREFSGLRYLLPLLDGTEQVEVKHIGCYFCGKQCGTVPELVGHLKHEHRMAVEFERHPLHKSSGSWGMITILTPPKPESKSHMPENGKAPEALFNLGLPDTRVREPDESVDQSEQNDNDYRLPFLGEQIPNSILGQNVPVPLATPPSAEGIPPEVFGSRTKIAKSNPAEPQEIVNNASPNLASRKEEMPRTPQDRDSKGRFSNSSLSSKSSKGSSATSSTTYHDMLKTKNHGEISLVSSQLARDGGTKVPAGSENVHAAKEAQVIIISSDSEGATGISKAKKKQPGTTKSRSPQRSGLEVEQRTPAPRPDGRTPVSSRNKSNEQKFIQKPKKPQFCTDAEPLPPVKRRKTAVPKAPSGVTFYRNISKRPLKEGELLSDSDSEIDNTYTKMRQRSYIDKIHGAKEAEKAFMKLFDGHFQDERHSGDRFIGEGLIRFAITQQTTLRCADMYRLFCTQAAVLKAENIVSDAQVVKCMDIIRGVKDNNNNDVRWRDLDPALFPYDTAKPAPKPWQQACLCGEVVENSYEIIGCDNTECPRGMFHLQCVGLEKVPKDWLCSECTGEVKMALD